MVTIKAFTSVEQSLKLAEILPLESADMKILPFTEREYRVVPINDIAVCGREDEICAWSLAALLDVLPDESEDNHFLTLSKEGAEYCCCYEDINGNSFRHTFADNPIDACVNMIMSLNELKML